MDFFTWIVVASVAIYVFQTREQRRRMRLLAVHLGPTQVEKLMGSLIDGYMRALEEKDPQRREQVWGILSNTEQQLADQFAKLANGFAKEPIEQTRVSTLPLALPYFDRIFPKQTFDMRQALQLHAQALRAACSPPDLDEAGHRRQAFQMTAEILLMQHTCHWFCKTRTVASIRLMGRHKTKYEQVLEAVAPATLRAYQKMLQGQ